MGNANDVHVSLNFSDTKPDANFTVTAQGFDVKAPGQVVKPVASTTTTAATTTKPTETTTTTTAVVPASVLSSHWQHSSRLR